MLIRKAADILYSEVTPKREYLSRRRFVASAAAGFALPTAAYAAKAAVCKADDSRLRLDLASAGHDDSRRES